MAITILTPGAVPFEDFRKRFSGRTQSVLSARLTSLTEKSGIKERVIALEGEEGSGFKTLIITLASTFVLSLILLLVINTSLTQDAFVLEHLKSQNNILKDQRDAILRQAALKASPAYVAAQATKLGMVPTNNPEFINLDTPELSQVSTSDLISTQHPTSAHHAKPKLGNPIAKAGVAKP